MSASRSSFLLLLAALAACAPAESGGDGADPNTSGSSTGAGGGGGAATTTSSGATSSSSSSSVGSAGCLQGKLCDAFEAGDALVETARPACPGGCGAIEVLDIERLGDSLFSCTARYRLMATPAGDVASSSPGIGSPQLTRCQNLAADLGDKYLLATNRGDAIAPVPQIWLLDVSFPGVVASITLDGASPEGAVAIAPSVFAVAMHGDGVWIYSAGGDDLTRIATLGGFENALALAAVGDRVYVADGSAGVATVDVSEPGSPVLLEHTPLVGGATEVTAGDGLLFAAAGAAGVHVLRLDDSHGPALAATIDTPGSAVDVAYDGGLIHVADWNDVRTYDVTTPEAPRFVGAEVIDTTLDFPRVLAVSASADRVVAGDWSGLYEYAVSPCLTAPNLLAPRLPVQFPRTDPGTQSAYSVVLRNEGADPLVIDSIQATGPFQALAATLTIPPGKKDFVEVRFAPGDPAPASGELLLGSNDPDEPVVSIELKGNQAALGVGDMVPDWEWMPIGGDAPLGTAGLRGNVVVLSYFATF
jgi:hypothetical protein